MPEHRSNPREAVILETEIHHPRLGVIRGATANIGAGGVFINNLPSDPMPRARLVDLSIHLREARPRVAYRVKAKLIHSSELGLGFRFLHTQQNLYNAVINKAGQEKRGSVPGR